MNGIYYWYPKYLQEQVKLDKDTSLDIFKLFSTGSLIGNLVMGLISDLAGLRSLIYELGLVLSCFVMFLISGLDESDLNS